MPHTSIDNNLNFNILFRKDLEGFIKVSQERLQGGKLCWNHLSFMIVSTKIYSTRVLMDKYWMVYFYE